MSLPVDPALMWLFLPAVLALTLTPGPDTMFALGQGLSSRAFRDGLIVNMSNPAVIFFILAFFPQFVDPARPILAQFLVFGGIIALAGFTIKAMVGVTAGGIGASLARDRRLERGLRMASATVFGGLALRLALSGGRL